MMYNESMGKENKRKRGKKEKQKKAKQRPGTKVMFMPADDVPADEADAEDLEIGDEDESGMYLEKEDLKIIYNALSKYTPTEEEEQLHDMLLEPFEEILVVDYDEPMPDVN
jgi:hypothetical protein